MLISHLQGALLDNPYRNSAWLDLGQLGVGIFFVLSGYLITSNLLSEETINLRRFYLRRFFRLAPCAWAYMLVLLLLELALHRHLIGKDAYGCVFFFRNYVGDNDANAMTDHFWSLSVEEQFYLVWPLIIWLCGRKRSFWVAVTIVVFIAAFRLHTWSYYDQKLRCLHTEVRADALLVGCILAFALRRGEVREWLSRHSLLIFATGIPLFLWDIYRYHSLIPLSESIVMALLIASTSLNASSPISRVLEFRHLKFLGVISYSVYVWQQIFLVPHWSLVFPFWIVIGTCLTALTAIASWAFIEQPCIRLGRRLESHLLMGKEFHCHGISVVDMPTES